MSNLSFTHWLILCSVLNNLYLIFATYQGFKLKTYFIVFFFGTFSSFCALMDKSWCWKRTKKKGNASF